jgi:hypothetical protein
MAKTGLMFEPEAPHLAQEDYTLSIDDAARRLNKSVRTIHRYKDGGRLSFITSTTQGNPLYFSRSEVEELARELFPNPSPAVSAGDSPFWDRLERVERLVAVLEHNPMLEQVLAIANTTAKSHQRDGLEDLLAQLVKPADAGTQPIDNKELGRLLVRLGNLLLNE